MTERNEGNPALNRFVCGDRVDTSEIPEDQPAGEPGNVERGDSRGFLHGLDGRAGAACVAVFAVAALLVCTPILTHLTNWGIMDWDQHTLHHAVARHAIIDFFEVPLWNPYNDGGVPLLASPESRALAPGFVLTLVFGEIVGLKLEIVLHQLLAMLGALLLLRYFGVGAIGAVTGALVFGLNTWYSIHLTVGHTWALNIAYMPWVLLFQRRALVSTIYVIPAALLLAVMFFGGGLYPLVMTLLLMVLSAAVDPAVHRRGARRQLEVLGLIAVLALPLASVKLLPAVEHIARDPRYTAVDGGYFGTGLLNALLDRDQALTAALAERPWEFRGTSLHQGLYVGAVPLLLIALGAFSQPRRAAPFLLVALVPLWIAMGTRIEPSIWAGLHNLPVFDSLRMPQRFGIAMILPAAIILGIGLDTLARLIAARWLRVAALGGIACWIFVDLVLVNRSVFAEAFPIPPRDIARNEAFAQRSYQFPYGPDGVPRRPDLTTTSSGLYPLFLANRGAVAGFAIVPVSRNAIGMGTPGYRGELFLDGAHGSASVTHWSPNRIEVALAVEAPDVLVVNQNFDPGWRVAGDPARPVISTRGLVSTAVGKSDERLSFYYRPKSFVVGGWISALTLLTLPVVARWVRSPHRPR